MRGIIQEGTLTLSFWVNIERCEADRNAPAVRITLDAAGGEESKTPSMLCCGFELLIEDCRVSVRGPDRSKEKTVTLDKALTLTLSPINLNYNHNSEPLDRNWNPSCLMDCSEHRQRSGGRRLAS